MPKPTHTGQVVAMHGVVTSPDERLFVHRNMIDRHRFVEFLSRHRAQIVPLREALDVGGLAITIDDATVAGLDAALLARDHGVPVSLFVNGENVELEASYSFAVLNTALDGIRGVATLGDHLYTLESSQSRRAFRKLVRARIRSCVTECERVNAIHEITQPVLGTLPSVPAHLRTLSVADIRGAIERGVDIQNHGWSHCHFGRLDEMESVAQVEKGQQWIRARFGVSSQSFAVPFGDVLPLSAKPTAAYTCWLLLHDVLHPGYVGPSVFNRMDIETAWSQL